MGGLLANALHSKLSSGYGNHARHEGIEKFRNLPTGPSRAPFTLIFAGCAPVGPGGRTLQELRGTMIDRATITKPFRATQSWQGNFPVRPQLPLAHPPLDDCPVGPPRRDERAVGTVCPVQETHARDGARVALAGPMRRALHDAGAVE